MFMGLNELKGLLIDLDSFKESDDEHWSSIDEDLDILFFSCSEERLNKIKRIVPRAVTTNDTPFKLFMSSKVIKGMLLSIGLKSYEIAIVSGSKESLRTANQLPLASIQIFNKKHLIYHEIDGYIPDFQINSVKEINDIYKKKIGGYFSEVYSTIYGYGNRLSYPQGGYVIHAIEDLHGNKVDIISGGRFFNRKDVRHDNHQLSQRLIKNKETGSQAKVLSPLYNILLNYINENIEKVDGLTRVPPRPNEGSDRFIEIVKTICTKSSQYKNESDCLICVKDYDKQKSLNSEQRKINVRNAFRVITDIEDKHIVLIDDTITTGSTVFEVANTLYEAGAQKVTILVMAINQMSSSFLNHKQKKLPCECGHEFVFRISGTDNGFYGCNNYPNCKNNKQYFDGLKNYNIYNEIAAEEVTDDDDEWNY